VEKDVAATLQEDDYFVEEGGGRVLREEHGPSVAQCAQFAEVFDENGGLPEESLTKLPRQERREDLCRGGRKRSRDDSWRKSSKGLHEERDRVRCLEGDSALSLWHPFKRPPRGSLKGRSVLNQRRETKDLA